MQSRSRPGHHQTSARHCLERDTNTERSNASDIEQMPETAEIQDTFES